MLNTAGAFEIRICRKPHNLVGFELKPKNESKILSSPDTDFRTDAR